jgi:signal transduction histidine kinase
MLDILKVDAQGEAFFQQSLEIYKNLEQNAWDLDGDQLLFYSSMLKDVIDKATENNSLEKAPEHYSRAIEDLQNSLGSKLNRWNISEFAKNSVLPSLEERMENYATLSPSVQRIALDYKGKDILVLYVPLIGKETGPQDLGFPAVLLQGSDFTSPIGSFLSSYESSTVSVQLRSTLTNSFIFGDSNASQENPVITEYFMDNFPPWRTEVYPTNDQAGAALYKNIFFWTILALLLILFLGSGLIIRTLVQEVNLLNLKSDFIASVSHEFKTPLTAMGAILERLQSGEIKDPQKTQEYYRILSHDSDKLKRLVKNVLDFTKIEKGKRDYRLVSTDINSLVRREVESFEHEYKLSGFELELKSKGNMINVLADEEALNQAFHNILDNAAKFSRSQKKIRIEVIQNEGTVEIAVQDWGIGIPDHEQKKIFDKFYRGKEAASFSPTGTGLGLTLVKHIIGAHRGEVRIQSKEGEGSRISLILPVEVELLKSH